MILPDSVQGLHLHSKQHVIYIYVEEDKYNEGLAFAEQYLSDVTSKQVEPVTPFEPFAGCVHCGGSQCSSLKQHPYKPAPWIGPGSPIMAIHQSSWNLAKLYTPTMTLENVQQFCKVRRWPCARWSVGLCHQAEGDNTLVSIAHGLTKFKDNDDLVFLTEVDTQGPIEYNDQIRTVKNGFYPATHIVEVGSSFSQKLDRNKAIDILKIKICHKADRALFQNKVKSACCGTYKSVNFDFNLPPATDTLGKPVTKRGICTGETYGNIAEWRRFYSRPGAKAPLQDSIAIQPEGFAYHGDSGSLVVATTNDSDEPCTLQAYGLVLGRMPIFVEDKKKMCVICSKLETNLSALSEKCTQLDSRERLP